LNDITIDTAVSNFPQVVESFFFNPTVQTGYTKFVPWFIEFSVWHIFEGNCLWCIRASSTSSYLEASVWRAKKSSAQKRRCLAKMGHRILNVPELGVAFAAHGSDAYPWPKFKWAGVSSFKSQPDWSLAACKWQHSLGIAKIDDYPCTCTIIQGHMMFIHNRKFNIYVWIFIPQSISIHPQSICLRNMIVAVATSFGKCSICHVILFHPLETPQILILING